MDRCNTSFKEVQPPSHFFCMTFVLVERRQFFKIYNASCRTQMFHSYGRAYCIHTSMTCFFQEKTLHTPKKKVKPKASKNQTNFEFVGFYRVQSNHFIPKIKKWAWCCFLDVKFQENKNNSCKPTKINGHGLQTKHSLKKNGVFWFSRGFGCN